MTESNDPSSRRDAGQEPTMANEAAEGAPAAAPQTAANRPFETTPRRAQARAREALAALKRRARGLSSRTRITAALVAVAIAAFGLGTLLGGGERDHDHRPGGAQATSEWTCSMHPQFRQAGPGQCPICGMDLIPVSAGGGGDERNYVVALSSRAKALAQVRTETVRSSGPGQEQVRLLGRVDYDETSLRLVTAWTGGRLDRLHVRVTGESIKRGQTVASLYSPEVYAAHQDLIQAKKQATKLSKGGGAALHGNSEMIVEATRERLRLLGFSNAAIERMEQQPKPSRNVAIATPFQGTVIERLATEGSYVMTGTPLYRVADLGRVWVQLDAYERDLPALAVGQKVELAVDALPGETIEGRVAFIDPVVDRRRRTASVRVEVANKAGKLRPGMFAEAIVHASGTLEQMSVPSSAALFTGRRSILYVQVPGAKQPTYEARAVRLGPLQGDRYPVLAGLQPGEDVVVHGAFLIDADLQIRGGTSMMAAPDDSQAHPIDEVVDVPAEFLAGLAPMMRSYLAIQRALAKDDLDTARTSASAFLDAVRAFEPSEPAVAVAVWSAIAKEVQLRGGQMHHTNTIAAFRRAFEHLSVAMTRVLRSLGNPLEIPLRLAHCPMAMDDRGAEWIQEGETIDNAYFGPAMLTCGSIRDTVAPGSRLPVTGLEASLPAAGHDPHAGHDHGPVGATDPHAAPSVPPVAADPTERGDRRAEPRTAPTTSAKSTSNAGGAKPAPKTTDRTTHGGH